MQKIWSVPEIREFLNNERGLSLKSLELREEWGSDKSEHRLKIRQGIQMTLVSKDPQILDLSHPPRNTEAHISISHCKGLGGFILANPKLSLGLDVEEKGRAKEKILRKVSSLKEQKLFAEPTQLWVAKEAALKAFLLLEKVQFPNQVFLTDSEKKDGLFYYRAHALASQKDQGRGWVFSLDSWELAVFCV